MRRIIFLSLISLLLVGTSISALADHREYRNYSEREIRELGGRNGYRLGLEAGIQDAREGYKFDYKRNPDYKFGMVGYRGEYRHDGNYKDGFRKGFENGYREGFDRAYRRGNNNGWGWGWGNNNRNRNNDRWNDNRGNDDRWNDNRRYDERDYDRNRPSRY